jgi:mono/diheme cytochrome c family protein
MSMRSLGTGTVVVAVVAAVSSWHGALASHGEPIKGEVVYQGTCIACHGENGDGAVPGVPGFAGRLANPDMTLIKHVIEGFASPNASIAMPPKGANPDLTEADAHDVVSYIRKRFGSSASKR